MSETLSIRWITKSFEQLTTTELYALGQLRQAVFVVEQDCPYLDFDGKDPDCFHLLGYDNTTQKLIAYTRLVPKGISYPNEIAIGRVVNHVETRGMGLGKRLMQQSITSAWQLWGKQSIRISAQDYLLRFYASLGFRDTGKKYLEDNIPHTEMLLEV